jgi:hypothetical protein
MAGFTQKTRLRGPLQSGFHEGSCYEPNRLAGERIGNRRPSGSSSTLNTNTLRCWDRRLRTDLSALVCIEEALATYLCKCVAGRATLPWLEMACSAFEASNPRPRLLAAGEAEVLQAGIIIHNERNLGLGAFDAIYPDDRVALFHSDTLVQVTIGAAWSAPTGRPKPL